MASLLNAAASLTSSVSSVLGAASAAMTAYQGLQSTVSSVTGGLINLPSGEGRVNDALNKGYTEDTILTNVWGKRDTTDMHRLGSNNNPEKAAFKWVEDMSTPDSFATPDSTIIYLGEPIYTNNPPGAGMNPIGMCQGFSFTSGATVTPIKELRCEETLVIPGKSRAGSISIMRLCGNYPSLADRLHGGENWNFSPHSQRFRQLFGLLVVFYTPSRSKQISTLYFERCALSDYSVALQAGTFQVTENVNIMFGRCINPADNTTYKNTVEDTTLTGKVASAEEYISNAAETVEAVSNASKQTQ